MPRSSSVWLRVDKGFPVSRSKYFFYATEQNYIYSTSFNATPLYNFFIYKEVIPYKEKYFNLFRDTVLFGQFNILFERKNSSIIKNSFAVVTYSVKCDDVLKLF